MRETIYQTQKGKIAEFDSVIQVAVSQGKVNHVSLSADQLQLFVGVLGGTLLTYNVHDIVQQVCVNRKRKERFIILIVLCMHVYRRKLLHHRTRTV